LDEPYFPGEKVGMTQVVNINVTTNEGDAVIKFPLEKVNDVAGFGESFFVFFFYGMQFANSVPK
jgi:hypothetical protein